MSSNFPPQRANRQRFLSSNSADCSLDTSLVGLLFVNVNSANPNGTDGGSKNPMSPQVSQSTLSPSSQSQRARKVESPQLSNTNANALRAAYQQSQSLSQSHRKPCIRKQQPSIDNNETDASHDDIGTSMTENPPSSSSTPSRKCKTKEISGKEKELLHNYASPVENSTQLEERCPQQRQRDRAQPCLLRLPTPEPIRRSISLPQRKKLSNDDNGVNDLTDQLQNCVIFARTMKPIVHRNLQPSSSIEDYCDQSDEYNCPISPNATSSCVSSLSADESQYYFSDLASVIKPPSSLVTRNSNVHRHHLEIQRIGEEKTGEIDLVQHHHQYCRNESPSHTLSSRRDCVPDQLAFTSLNTLSADRENSAEVAVQSRREKLQIHSAEDLDSREAALQRHSQHYRKGSDTRSLEPKRPPPYSQRAISSSTTPNIRYDSCNSRGFTNQNHTTMAKQRYQGKKLMSRKGSFTQPSTLDKPALMHQRSGSSITNTTMSSSQYGRHSRSIWGGENSTASASNDSLNESSITVNGMVVNRIKHRRIRSENNIPLTGGVGGMVDDHNHVAGHNSNSIYEAAILRKASGLEISTSLDSQVANASSFESPRSNLSHSFTLMDDATSRSTSRSCGVTESSMNGITSTSSGTTTQRKRRRRRAKDEFKYFVGKLVPGPVKVMKAVLTKKKTYDLERSSGCLT